MHPVCQPHQCSKKLIFIAVHAERLMYWEVRVGSAMPNPNDYWAAQSTIDAMELCSSYDGAGAVPGLAVVARCARPDLRGSVVVVRTVRPSYMEVQPLALCEVELYSAPADAPGKMSLESSSCG